MKHKAEGFTIGNGFEQLGSAWAFGFHYRRLMGLIILAVAASRSGYIYATFNLGLNSTNRFAVHSLVSFILFARPIMFGVPVLEEKLSS